MILHGVIKDSTTRDSIDRGGKGGGQVEILPLCKMDF